MHHFFSLVLLVTLFVNANFIQAQDRLVTAGSRPDKAPQHRLDFIRNEGQWEQAFRFKAMLKEGVFFLTDDGFVYNFAEEARDTIAHEGFARYHAYKVKFEGCNKAPRYSEADRRSYYHNYYIGNDRSKWAAGVRISGKLTQHNIYQGIDLTVYSEGNNLKYDFLVAPGAAAEQIKMAYEGVLPHMTNEGHLRIATTINEVAEQKPYCYQVVNGKVKEVASRYQIKGNVVSFDFPDGYDKSVPLVIDPEVIFSTYSGAAYIPPPSFYAYAGLPAHATTYDKAGKLYSSVTINSLGWPVTLGAYQSLPNTKRDIAINVFEPDGTSIAYATYFGGISNEIALTMLTNDEQELFIAGSTASNDLPMTSGCFDSTYNGATVVPADNGTDIFVAHFNNNGTQLLGATYLGGSENELVPAAIGLNVVGVGTLNGINIVSPIEITLDSLDNIWLISNTISTNFPVTANAQQPVYAGGQTDGVLCKLNQDCSQLLYSSYLGSSGFDIGSSIIFNKSGKLVICGATNGSNFPVTPGAFLITAPGGISDGFVAIVNPANGSLQQASYLGTNLADHACIVQVDPDDNVYVTGRTYGAYPVSAGVFSIANGDVFLQKLNPLLSTSLISTCIGNPVAGVSRMIPTGFVYTECDEIIFSGFAHGDPSAALPVTADAIMANPRKFWFCRMPANFSVISHASFFGSSNYLDSRYCGTSHYAPDGTIYQSLGSSTFTTFPTSPTAWSPATQIVQPVPKTDAVSFKIGLRLHANFILDAAVNSNDSGCAPYSILPVNTSSGANLFVWNFGDGTPSDTVATAPLHTYTNPGSYIVTLYAFNDALCVKGDTAFLSITVVEPAVLPDITVSDTVLCNGAAIIDLSVQINNFNPNYEVLWTPGNGLLSPANQPTVTVDPLINNTYYVTVTNNILGLCEQSATDTVTITLAPLMLQLNTQDTTVCEGALIQVSADGNPQYLYTWSPATGMNDSTLLEPEITVTQSENYMLKASYPGCPDTFVFLNIIMESMPVVQLGPDKSICPGLPVALESMISPFHNDYLYSWTPNTGNLSNPDGPNTSLLSDTSITYTLTVQTPVGCSGSDSIHILVFPGVDGDIIPDTGYCPGGSVTLFASGGSVYSWTPSYGLDDTTIAAPTASPGTSTNYTVIISNQYNCSETQNVSIQVFPNAVLNMPDSVSVYPGEAYSLEPGTNCLYFSWFPPSGISNTNVSNPVFDPEVRTRYFVTATTEQGCEVKDSIDVLVKETVWDIPNAFAPAGNNSVFRPAIRGLATLKQFVIFNRWGNKVYSSVDINSGWDGTFNGQPQPAGVYVYLIEGVTDKGSVLHKQGNVTLLR
ncbi:MAG: gliding motility-associated C-terminal domain-containing protein [Taibaiella sp.]|jgi:gliding motility-associated-like protein